MLCGRMTCRRSRLDVETACGGILSHRCVAHVYEGEAAAIEFIERLLHNASIEDVMEELHFLTKVRRGLSQIEAGQVVSHGEVKRRLSR